MAAWVIPLTPRTVSMEKIIAAVTLVMCARGEREFMVWIPKEYFSMLTGFACLALQGKPHG